MRAPQRSAGAAAGGKVKVWRICAKNWWRIKMRPEAGAASGESRARGGGGEGGAVVDRGSARERERRARAAVRGGRRRERHTMV